jgi:galactokinase
MAIEPHVLIVYRGRQDGKIRLASVAFPGLVEFSVDEPITAGDPKWANYSKGVAAEMKAAGIPLVGMDALISNTLPVGGGLSSSAAIEVGTGQALLSLAGLEMELMRLVLICQKAEHEYANVPCGIMDQTAVAGSRADHAMLLDCRTFARQFVPIDSNELRVVIVNSMVKHELSGGEYRERREQCEAATAYFKRFNPSVTALRDVTMKQVDGSKGKLDDLPFRRARHVVGENARCTEFATQLTKKMYEKAGELMVQSHNSLRDDYNVSVEELDFLVAEAVKVKGVYGARMTGGGFGGCIVALVQPRAVESLDKHLKDVYPARFGKAPAVYVTTATAGVTVVE